MSWDCPDRASQARSSQTEESVEPEKETKELSIKQITAEQLVDLVQNMDQAKKDKVIQDVFMKDF